MEECDDGALSEITILPDGRVYLFGMTLPLLEVLATLPTRESQWKALLARCQPPCESIGWAESSRPTEEAVVGLEDSAHPTSQKEPCCE